MQSIFSVAAGLFKLCSQCELAQLPKCVGVVKVEIAGPVSKLWVMRGAQCSPTPTTPSEIADALCDNPTTATIAFRMSSSPPPPKNLMGPALQISAQLQRLKIPVDRIFIDGRTVHAVITVAP